MKILSLLEACLFSLANFAVVFYFGSQGNLNVVYTYGAAQSSALIFLAFYRNYVLLKLQDSPQHLSISVAISLLFYVFLILSCVTLLKYHSALFFVSVFLFNVIYESARYQVRSLVVFCKIAFFFLFGILIFYRGAVDQFYLMLIFTVESTICIALLLFYHFRFYKGLKIKLRGYASRGPIFFLSVSQVAIVHAPFFYMPLVFGKELVGAMFIYRSAFQLVQVVMRSVELSYLNRIHRSDFSFVDFRMHFIQIGALVGAISFFAFMALEFLLNKSIDIPIHGFFIWYIIFVLMSYMRAYDFYIHRSMQYKKLLKAYTLGSFTSIIFTLLIPAMSISFMSAHPSAAIAFGWFCAVCYISFSKDKNCV
jgi:hypothetical protein